MRNGRQKQGWELDPEATDSVNGADVESGTMIPAVLEGKSSFC